MNIVPKLNLNKHPKDNDNLSFVNALNVKISNDESCITNEESIRENEFIHNYFIEYYGATYLYKIVGIIPCNEELVIIVSALYESTQADIFRYREANESRTEQIYCAYGGKDSKYRLDYQGGLIVGTFTYNVENSLIIAIAEYNVSNAKIPLKTINLGNFDDETVYNDKDLPNSFLAISPEITLPTVSGLEYVSGSAYKGWYYLFIRYKINSVDYAQWHSIGFPIYIDTLEQYQIIRYCYNRETRMSEDELGKIVTPSLPYDGFCAGGSDYFSNASDIAKETFKVNIRFSPDTVYTKYQIGIVCASKSYLKAFRTSDIYLDVTNASSYTGATSQYTLDNKALIDYSVNEFIIDNYNYFNVKTIINYQNRLYISNYLENSANNRNIPREIIDNIVPNLYKSSMSDYGITYDVPIIKGDDQNYPNQYESSIMTLVPMYKYLGVSKNTEITIYEGLNIKKDVASHFYITTGGVTPGFAYIEHRANGPLGSTVITNFGKDIGANVSIVMSNKENGADVTIEFHTRKHAINGGSRYINTKTGFNNRKSISTLIPGEVYNFFIHFVDKYGHATNGYRIDNKIVWTTVDDTVNEIIPIPFRINIGEEYNKNYVTYYAAPFIDSNVAINSSEYYNPDSYDINTKDVRFYKNYNISNPLRPHLYNPVDASERERCVKFFKEFYNSYANEKFLNYKWYQIAIQAGDNNFHIYINNNGERLFKVPFGSNFSLGINGFPGSVDDSEYYNVHTLYRAMFTNIEIPNGYDGFFISYEQYEPLQRVTGLLTRNDFRSQDYIVRTEYENGNWVNKAIYARLTSNSGKSDKMMFYSGMFDVSDSLKLDYNIIRIEGVNVYDTDDIPTWDYFQRASSINFPHDFNKPQTGSYGNPPIKTYAMPEYKIAVADSAADDRMGLGTGLQIKDAYNLFPNYTPTSFFGNYNKIKLYRATLVNCTRNLYMSNNKKLIRLTDVYYKNKNYNENYKYSTSVIYNGYNGHYTYDGVLIYENAGASFNESDNKVRGVVHNNEYYRTSVTRENPHTYENDIPFAAYLQFPVCTDMFFESKCFKNNPKGIVFLSRSKDEHNTYATGCMVTPANSIDLFQNKQGTVDQFNPKTYVNYREDLVSVEEFDKTIRRSNVIQDESRINGWRIFPVEAYKNITENKGKVTNILGIGTLLLAHTEHSLFMFDTDNTLKTEGKDIQLNQPDAFEVNYKEVFTSDLGYGGLQDNKSWIVDQFGYIFYNNDFNRFYHFDNGQLAVIDDDIIEWLNKYKPFNVRFANDKHNNRLLIRMDCIVGNRIITVTISYNYNTKYFVSFHSYYFDKAFSTKTGLYMQCDNSHPNCSLHQFINDGDSYCEFDNVKDKSGVPTIYPSKISIITNDVFDEVKFLEYITYKLSKIAASTAIESITSPVEEFVVPFAGNTLTVYNNQVNTGVLDINVNKEDAKNIFANYDKPYWDLGVWNYSYFRNNINKLNEGVPASEMSRLFGNYFILEFVFDNLDGHKVEFEELMCKLTKDKKI